MRNKFGERVRCSDRSCESVTENYQLYAVGEFRGDHDYTILCQYHSEERMKHKNRDNLKSIAITQGVYDGKHNLSKDYNVFSSQTPERKAVFSNAKGLGSEGKKETSKKE